MFDEANQSDYSLVYEIYTDAVRKKTLQYVMVFSGRLTLNVMCMLRFPSDMRWGSSRRKVTSLRVHVI